MPKPVLVLEPQRVSSDVSLRAEVGWSGHDMLFTLPFPGGWASVSTPLPSAEAWTLDLLKMVQDARVELASKEMAAREEAP